MKIDLEMHGLKFCCDLRTGNVEVFKPIRKLDEFNLESEKEINYMEFRKKVGEYLLKYTAKEQSKHDYFRVS